MSEAAPAVPAGLVVRGRGRRLWKQIVGLYELRPDELEVLGEVCRQADLLDVLAEIVAADGPILATGQGPKVHAALVEARLTRVELRRGLGALGLRDVDGVADEVSVLRSVRARKAARARWDKRVS